MRTLRMEFGLVVAALVALAANRPTQVSIPVGGKASDDYMPECPHSWSSKRPNSPLAWKHRRTDVPEFHDCQRLRVLRGEPPRERYGPLAAVFAEDSLEFVSDSTLAPPGTGSRAGGRMLAIVYLPYFPQEGGYLPLGLSNFFACVIVQRVERAGRAWIVPVEDGKECSAPSMVSTAAGTTSPYDLRVLPPPRGMLGRDIPPVARWDWDEKTRTQYIGVRCGGAWCEIGVRGFQSSASHDPGPANPDGRAGYALRGAYDEQRLAEFPGGVLTPALNLGTVVPMPDLRELTRQRPPAGKWVPVARTHLAPTAGTYDVGFNFAPTATVSPTETRASTISLCTMSPGSRPCAARDPNATLDVSQCTEETPGGARWIARVDRPMKESSYFCVLYRKHEEGFFVPPVVRWRWRADDETIWISCPSGCCEVNAKKGT